MTSMGGLLWGTYTAGIKVRDVNFFLLRVGTSPRKKSYPSFLSPDLVICSLLKVSLSTVRPMCENLKVDHFVFWD